MTPPRRPVTVEAIARDADVAGGRVRIAGLDGPVEVARMEGKPGGVHRPRSGPWSTLGSRGLS